MEPTGCIIAMIVGVVLIVIAIVAPAPWPKPKCPRCGSTRYHHYCSRCGLLVPHHALRFARPSSCSASRP